MHTRKNLYTWDVSQGDYQPGDVTFGSEKVIVRNNTKQALAVTLTFFLLFAVTLLLL